MLVLYLFSAFPIGEDGDFSQEQAILMYNAKLSNNLGNLLNRFIALSLKLDGKINNENVKIEHQRERNYFLPVEYTQKYLSQMAEFNLKGSIDYVFSLASNINGFVDETKPWKIDTSTEE